MQATQSFFEMDGKERRCRCWDLEKRAIIKIGHSSRHTHAQDRKDAGPHEEKSGKPEDRARNILSVPNPLPKGSSKIRLYPDQIRDKKRTEPKIDLQERLVIIASHPLARMLLKSRALGYGNGYEARIACRQR